MNDSTRFQKTFVVRFVLFWIPMGYRSKEDWGKFCRRAVPIAFLLLPVGNDNRRDGTKFRRASCSPKSVSVLSFARGLEPKDKEK